MQRRPPCRERIQTPPPTMTGRMESQRSSFALGPLEISFKRRDEGGARYGWLGSLVMHVIVIALLMSPAAQRIQNPAVPEPVPQPKPPIPITFVDPLRPPPAPKPPA